MNIEINDSALKRNNVSESDVRLQIALVLYKQRAFSMGQACKFAGLHLIQFQMKMKENNVYLNYDLDMLDNDMKFVNKA